MNAKRVVLDDISDVREALKPVLRNIVVGVTRRYEVADVGRAENHAQYEVVRAEPGARYGLDCQMFVRLTTDEVTVAHAQNVRSVGHQITVEQHNKELERLREENRQLLVRQRTAMYQEFIDKGLAGQAALQLGQNPDDVAIVTRMLENSREQDRHHAVEFFGKLLDSGAIERHEVSDQLRGFLSYLKDWTDGVIAPPSSAPSVPSPSKPLPGEDIPEPVTNLSPESLPSRPSPSPRIDTTP